MLSAKNSHIVCDVVLPEIDEMFNFLMLKCNALSEFDHFPGTNIKKSTVRRSKLEFDDRVEDWLKCMYPTV